METMQIDSEVRVERVRSKRQVCDLLGISPSTLTRWVARALTVANSGYKAPEVCNFAQTHPPFGFAIAPSKGAQYDHDRAGVPR